MVPEALAVELPDTVGDEMGACFGIPGVTAHRAVFADGPVRGQIMLVQGVRGSVGSLAAQLARGGGATVIGTVRTDAEAGRVDPATADYVVSLQSEPVPAIRRLAPDGVDRIIDVALSAKDAAARDLTEAAAQSALLVTVAEVFPLERLAAAHELTVSGKARGRVLLSLP